MLYFLNKMLKGLMIFLSALFFFTEVRSADFSVAGRVFNADNIPLKEATVLLSPAGNYCITNSNGEFSLSAITPGVYHLTIQHIGYKSHQQKITVAGVGVFLNIQMEEDVFLTEEISVTANVQKLHEEPVGKILGVEEVSKDYMLKNQGNTLMQTLESLPGINALHTGVGISKPVIRGMSFNRVIVNEYGIKQEGQQWGVDHGLELDQFNVEEVEIQKGPVSLFYGSDGIAGVINIKRVNIPHTDTFRMESLAQYKSNNDSYSTSLMLEKTKKDFWIKGRLTWTGFADYHTPAEEFTYNSYKLPILNNRLKNTAGKELNYSLHAGWQKKWGQTSLFVSNYGQQAGFFSGAFGIPRAYQLQDDGLPRNIELPSQSIRHIKVISNTVIYLDKFKINIDAGYQFNKREEFSYPHTHGQQLPPQGNLALQLKLQTYTYNIRTKYRVRDNWDVYFGSNGQLQNNKNGGFEFLIPAYHSWQAGAYLLHDIQLKNGLQWQAGARIDAAFQKAGATYIAVYEADIIREYQQRSPQLRKNYWLPSFSTGISYPFSAAFKTGYNLGTAFRVPTIAELTSNGVHHGTFRHELGDPELDLERGLMQDVSISWKKSFFELQLTPYFYHFQNYIYLRPSARFSPLPDAGQIYNYQQGKVNMTGTEARIKVSFLKNFLLSSTFEYLWNKNMDLGHPLPFTPPVNILNTLEYNLNHRHKNFNQTYAQLAVHTFSAQKRVDQNEKETPGYTLVNLSAGSTIRIKRISFEIKAQIRNLFNTAYLNNMSRYRILNLPEQGRNTQVMLVFRM